MVPWRQQEHSKTNGRWGRDGRVQICWALEGAVQALATPRSDVVLFFEVLVPRGKRVGTVPSPRTISKDLRLQTWCRQTSSKDAAGRGRLGHNPAPETTLRVPNAPSFTTARISPRAINRPSRAAYTHYLRSERSTQTRASNPRARPRPLRSSVTCWGNPGKLISSRRAGHCVATPAATPNGMRDEFACRCSEGQGTGAHQRRAAEGALVSLELT